MPKLYPQPIGRTLARGAFRIRHVADFIEVNPQVSSEPASVDDITDLLIGHVLAKVLLSLVLVPFLITFGVRGAQWLDSPKKG